MKKILSSLISISLLAFMTACSSDSGGGGSGSQKTAEKDGTTTLKIQESGDGFVSTTGSIKENDTNWIGYSGDGYIESLTSGKTVVYTVKADAAISDAKIAVHYGMWNAQTMVRGVLVKVNGVTINNGNAIKTTYTNKGTKGQNVDGRWIDSAYLTDVSLNQGSNTIIIEGASGEQTFDGETYTPTDAGCLPNIDYLIVNGMGINYGTDKKQYYSLAYSSENETAGSVTGGTAEGSVAEGTSVTLTAAANSGWTFECWSDGTTSNPYTFKLSGNTSLYAHFIPTGATVPAGLFGYATLTADKSSAKYTITGGTGGTELTISSLAELEANKAILSGNDPYIINISGLITTADAACPNVSRVINLGSNKTLQSGTTQGQLQNIGVKVQGKNIIIKNLKFGEVIADSYYANLAEAKAAGIKRGAADAMELNGAEHVWIDHCEFQSHLTPMAFNSSGVLEELTFDASKTAITVEHDYESPEIAWRKDYYDGLLDIKNQSRFITVSNCYFHDHYKACLCGSNDTDSSEKVMRVTFYYNYWKNINARAPLFRFGKAHVFSSYFTADTDCDWMYMTDNKDGSTYSISQNVQATAINCRASSELYIDNNYFENLKIAVGHYNGDSDTPGTWTTINNLGFEDGEGNSYEPPYAWSSALKTASAAKTYVLANAGVVSQ